MSSEKTTRITEADRDSLNDLSSRYGIKSSTILGHLIDYCIKYGMLDDGWETKLAEKELAEYLKDADLDFRKKVEIMNIKARINAQMMVFKNWLAILGPTEKRQFLENVMGANRGEDFLEKLANYQMFLIDGVKRLYPPDTDGYPIISYTQKGALIKCVRGYHIKNNRCDCRYWAECEYGAKAFEEWLAEHGSQLERQRYLEESTGQKYFRRQM